METTKLYVGNLNYSVGEDRLQKVFSDHGSVKSTSLITDRDTGRSKGFAFIEMSSKDEVQAAISALDGKDLEGRALKVNEARPKNDSRRRSGGGHRRSY